MSLYRIGDRVISNNFDQNEGHQLHAIYLGSDQVITYPTLPSSDYLPYQTVLMPLKYFTSGEVSLCVHGEPTPPIDYVVNRAVSTLINGDQLFDSSEEFVDWCFKIAYPERSTASNDLETTDSYSGGTSTNDVIDAALQTASLAIPFVNKKYGIALGVGIGIASAINQIARE